MSGKTKTAVCTPCGMAIALEAGKVASGASPESLHAQCDDPGLCTCGCDYSKGRRCRECGRARTPAQLGDGLVCLDRTECAVAIVGSLLGGTRVPPQQARYRDRNKPLRTIKEIAAAAGPIGGTTPAAALAASGKSCECGCGTATRGTWAPGHDARHAGRLLREARAGSAESLAELERRWPSKVPSDLRAR